jgi:hypothetical protein
MIYTFILLSYNSQVDTVTMARLRTLESLEKEVYIKKIRSVE